MRISICSDPNRFDLIWWNRFLSLFEESKNGFEAVDSLFPLLDSPFLSQQTSVRFLFLRLPPFLSQQMFSVSCFSVSLRFSFNKCPSLSLSTNVKYFLIGLARKIDIGFLFLKKKNEEFPNYNFHTPFCLIILIYFH